MQAAERAHTGSGPETAVKSSVLVPWLWAQIGLGRQTNHHHPGACRLQRRVVQREHRVEWRVDDSKHLVRGWSAPSVHASWNLLKCLALSCKGARQRRKLLSR